MEGSVRGTIARGGFYREIPGAELWFAAPLELTKRSRDESAD